MLVTSASDADRTPSFRGDLFMTILGFSPAAGTRFCGFASAIRPIRTARRLMKDQGTGDVINIASTSGMKDGAGGTAYAGSKWARRGISQYWQAEG
jgi:NAD(P)-dependent dehydrogenase (short-subunit alcohol dehydrogenase family)